MTTNTVNVRAYIGLDYGAHEWSAKQAIKCFGKAFAAYGIDGFTAFNAVGYWCGEYENSIVVDVLECAEEAAEQALQAIANKLMQWEIVYTVDGETRHLYGVNVEENRAALNA